MNYFHWIVGTILGLAWFSRIVDAAFGMKNVADISRPEWDRKLANSPRVSIIVPARNESEDIEDALTRLFSLDYDNYEVIAINDRSTDGTGVIMDRVASSPTGQGKIKVIHIKELPPGWLGKPHAMWSAANQATGEWLLFTDADVLFKPDTIRRAVAYAEAEPADHVVLFPKMIMKGPGERLMIAFFQTLFVFGHRPWKVADPKTDDHMGVGAFNMIRRNAYEKVGTYKRLRLEILDDMKMGKIIKRAGFAQRNVFGEDLISIHWAKGTMGVVNNLTKNFYAVLSYQWPRAILSCFALGILNWGPFAGTIFVHGWTRIPYTIALLSMLLIYVGMSTRSAIPPYYFVLHPISTFLFCYAVMRSTFLTLRQGGVVWRGTFYALEELKRGLV